MSKSVILKKTKEIEMLEAVKDRVHLLTIQEAMSECIRYTYERVCGETVETTSEIVDNYRETIRGLRKELRITTDKIMKSNNPEEISALMGKLGMINKVVNITRNIAQADGDFNDVMFDVVAKGKLIVDNRKVDSGNDRNIIMRDKVNHDINMAMLTSGMLSLEGE